MKYPIFIATLGFISAGVALAAPPTKLHHPNVKDLRTQQQERIENCEMKSTVSQQRPATIALNFDKGKKQARDLNRNQFHSYRQTSRLHSSYERR